MEPVGQQNQKLGVFAGLSMVVAAIGIYTAVPPFLSMPANISTGAAAAAGLAVVSCIGNIGGFVAPYAVGVLNDLTGSSARAVFPGLVPAGHRVDLHFLLRETA